MDSLFILRSVIPSRFIVFGNKLMIVSCLLFVLFMLSYLLFRNLS